MSKENNNKWQGLVIDRVSDQVVHQTRYYATEGQAHLAAERLAKRHGHYDIRYRISTI